ncbi:hypothetical protein M408DRAFT_30995 [Serendipita vermifera MAFF 305830]|uniref:Aminoglycoside phosphotransferase domain-containing protein n=1 Tax=Serendipita vermifera MAFF 305830 TaxID=933852 RepID=A0A0C2VZJ0_SERVB|nr:hypothetical protein M408DRAFT_30995 [Serendipita vermifera MAFF 305830]
MSQGSNHLEPPLKMCSYKAHFEPGLSKRLVVKPSPIHRRLGYLLGLAAHPYERGVRSTEGEHIVDTYARYTRVTPVDNPPFENEYLVEITEKTPPISDGLSTHRINSGTIVKLFADTEDLLREAHSINLVRCLTSIPVPNVRQLLVSPIGSGMVDTYMVMDYVEGESLDKCWGKLGLISKIKIAWQLRGYVSQLQTIQTLIPGPVDGSACVGFYFTETGAGPFASYDDMTAWFNHKLSVNERFAPRPPGTKKLDTPNIAKFDMSWPLVFTHQDLCPRNIILSKDGSLCIVDWAWAGFYPAWFEYAGMKRYDDLPASWNFFIPFISGKLPLSNMEELHSKYLMGNRSWCDSLVAG